MKRVLTAAVLIPASVYLVVLAPRPLFLAAALFMAVMCFHEYRKLAAAHGVPVWGPFGYAAGVAVMLAPRAELLVAALIALLALVLALRSEDLSLVLPRSSALILGVLYTFSPWRFAVGLRDLNAFWLLYALALVWVGDTAAYCAGKGFGRHPLAPRLSPAKTWEGAAASLLASGIFGVVYVGSLIPETPRWEVVVLTVVATVSGQLGDLAESALKRGAQVKDSGNLLPGHGGFLDRLDSSLFTIPVVYFWLVKPWQG
jgi:phosphatidate cytidylyltransferase